jgi:hypothetical protein
MSAQFLSCVRGVAHAVTTDDDVFAVTTSGAVRP